MDGGEWKREARITPSAGKARLFNTGGKFKNGWMEGNGREARLYQLYKNTSAGKARLFNTGGKLMDGWRGMEGRPAFTSFTKTSAGKARLDTAGNLKMDGCPPLPALFGGKGPPNTGGPGLYQLRAGKRLPFQLCKNLGRRPKCLTYAVKINNKRNAIHIYVLSRVLSHANALN